MSWKSLISIKGFLIEVARHIALLLLAKGKGYLKSSQTLHRERKAFGSSD